MRILVISDSHRILHNVRDSLEILKKDVDMVFHLGDCRGDMDFFIELYKDIEFHCVNGNCDFDFDGKQDEVVDVNGKKIWLTHGHAYNVKAGYDKISYAAEEKGVDVCLFGHTHMPVIFKHNEIYYMNPGSISLPRGIDKPSYGILNISDKGDISCSIVSIVVKKRYKTINSI